MKYVLVFCKEL